MTDTSIAKSSKIRPETQFFEFAQSILKSHLIVDDLEHKRKVENQREYIRRLKKSDPVGYLKKKSEYQREYRREMSVEKREEYLRKQREAARKCRERQKMIDGEEFRRKKAEQQKRYRARLKALSTASQDDQPSTD